MISVEQLAQNTKSQKARAAYKPFNAQKPHYVFLDKKHKAIIDHVTLNDVVRWLDDDDDGCVEVCWVLGILADLKLKAVPMPISKDHEQILRLIKVLFDEVRR